MKFLTIISRLLVGSLFIVSGLIKANDPIGFSYKLKDYFAPDVLNLEFLIPLVLPLAVLICIAEIVLGFATLFGNRIKIVSWLLLLMIIFFTFLTFYSAYFEKVTDCGCFGDALKLTPWQSFSKDLILLIFVSIIFKERKNIRINTLKQDVIYALVSIGLIAIFSYGVILWGFPVFFSSVIFAIIYFGKNNAKFSSHSDKVVLGIPALLSILFSLHVLNHLPIRDFRPYAIGKSIPEQMIIPEGALIDEYKNIWYYKDKQDNTKQFSDKDKPWENKDLVFVDRESILITKGYEPPIHDFNISSIDGEDFTNYFLSDSNYVFIIIAYDISDKENQIVSKDVNDLAATCQEKKISFIGLTASGYDAIDTFRHEVQAMYNYYTTDEKTLQTIIRSNPGLLLLKNGIIKGKWHNNDIPDYDEAMKFAAES